MPKFALLIYEDESAAPVPPSPEWRALWEAYGRLDEEAMAAGALIDSQPFAPAVTALTISHRDGRAQETPGPAENTPRQLTGYYLVSCADQADAVRWAAKIPAAGAGRVEIRRILDGPGEP